MQPINAPSVRNYNNTGTRNNGFQYKLMPLSFNLQQKGNSKSYISTDERNKFNIGDIVTGICLYDSKEHTGYITQIIYDEKTNKPLSVYIMDYETKFNLPLNYSTLEIEYKYNLYESFNFDKAIKYCKKLKRPLKYIKGLFDDLYDIDQETNQEIDLADEIYKQNIGDVLYKNKKPYAICCGLKEDFNDNNYRYLLLNNMGYDIWTDMLRNLPKLKTVYSDSTIIKSKNDIIKVDKDGYENTQIIKNNYNINNFPLFRYCYNLGDNVYLPAIDELEYLCLYLDDIIKSLSSNKKNIKIIKSLEQIKDLKRISTSSHTSAYTYYIMNFQTKQVSEILKEHNSYIIPFIRI